MLILTRKVNQKLIINDNIEIVVLESYNNAVKIGVNAPSDVQIYREEIYNEINTKLSTDTNNGWNALTNEYVTDMYTAGIIDPVKVTRTALESAASVAGLLLTTECVMMIKEEPDKNPIDPRLLQPQQ